MTTETDPPRWQRKHSRQMLIGGAAGFVTVLGMARFIDSPVVGGLDASAGVAALVSAVYCIMAVGIFIGALKPQLGAHFLNVEDADDLREQRPVLIYSAAAAALWGVALLALALAAPSGPVSQNAALAVGAGGLVVGALLAVQSYRMSDELMLAMNLESAALTYGLVVLVLGMWSIFAHLGYATGPQPLDLLTTFYVLVLLATFIVAGRRGMLTVK